MKLHAGMQCVIDCGSAKGDFAGVHGEICQLIQHLGDYTCHNGTVRFAWRVELHGKRAIVGEPYLKPFYDGDEPSTWSKCVWQPRELMKV